MSKEIDLNQTREYLLKLIPQAGEILRKYFASGEFTSKSKEGVDVLTQADEEVEEFLKENISKKFPQTAILAEETSPKDYDSFKYLDNLWVIDPLDGTVNFSRGNPHFAISVGLVDKGVSRLGVVYAPVENNLYWAQENQDKAYLNGRPIKTSSTKDLKETVLACDWGWKVERRLEVVRWLQSIATSVRQIKSMGSTVADLANLASGRIDVYLHSDLKPWDVAASSLLIEKAEGRITTPQGGKWDIFQPEILATNGILHHKILDLLK